ncbi:conserved hypothetical protein [Streptomyces sviceus ATCC 29083]|uniref:Uncharacterized protein n=1 Tax=Streptomyces sviceus (strain ATCC 29083 / DSM 924 / JCM 4929 / NBRC 13980 / NCIMB 11184 / NRRL 5439 / UC 5370) TaxID=463191 RepID=B5HLS8_STRX2|nr:conserved hypothetical protein [Streptomyces sviceus ATCC 29083]
MDSRAAIDSRAMEEITELGEISCPSGNLVVPDSGHLGLWSGERSPAEIDPVLLGIDDVAMADDILGAVDFAVVGPDASEAARSFDRQPGALLHDIPASQAAVLGARFEEHCLGAGLDARVEALPRRERPSSRWAACLATGGCRCWPRGSTSAAGWGRGGQRYRFGWATHRWSRPHARCHRSRPRTGALR